VRLNEQVRICRFHFAGLELCDALSAAATLSEPNRQILKLFPQRLALIETQMDTLEKSVGQALRE